MEDDEVLSWDKGNESALTSRSTGQRARDSRGGNNRQHDDVKKVGAYPTKLEDPVVLETYRVWRFKWRLWSSEAPCPKERIGRRTVEAITSTEAWNVIRTIPESLILGGAASW